MKDATSIRFNSTDHFEYLIKLNFIDIIYNLKTNLVNPTHKFNLKF